MPARPSTNCAVDRTDALGECVWAVNAASTADQGDGLADRLGRVGGLLGHVCQKGLGSRTDCHAVGVPAAPHRRRQCGGHVTEAAAVGPRHHGVEPRRAADPDHAAHGRGDEQHGVGLPVTAPPGRGRRRHHGEGVRRRVVAVGAQPAGRGRGRHAHEQLLAAGDQQVRLRRRGLGVALARGAVGGRLVARSLPTGAPTRARCLGEPFPGPERGTGLRRLLRRELVGQNGRVGRRGVAELGDEDRRAHRLRLRLRRLIAEREVGRIPARLGRKAQEVLLHGEGVGVDVRREDQIGIGRERRGDLEREVEQVPVGQRLVEDLLVAAPTSAAGRRRRS